jgi:hypothetical protein
MYEGPRQVRLSFSLQLALRPRVLAGASEDIPYPRVSHAAGKGGLLAASQRMHPDELTVISGDLVLRVRVIAACIMLLGPLLHAFEFSGRRLQRRYPANGAICDTRLYGVLAKGRGFTCRPFMPQLGAMLYHSKKILHLNHTPTPSSFAF